MTRDWKLSEPAWCWPDDVDETGTEPSSASRYLPLINTDKEKDGYNWLVAKILVDEDDPEMLEDARLIEAAPDLLGALQSLLHQVQQMRGMFPDEDGTIAAAVEDAEDAVAKARGIT